jgi:hypothetical protein
MQMASSIFRLFFLLCAIVCYFPKRSFCHFIKNSVQSVETFQNKKNAAHCVAEKSKIIFCRNFSFTKRMQCVRTEASKNLAEAWRTFALKTRRKISLIATDDMYLTFYLLFNSVLSCLGSIHLSGKKKGGT